MKDLWSTAERLRAVQAARKKFITLWAVDQAFRLFEKQWEQAHQERQTPVSLTASTALDLPGTRWRWLYRGSILDD